MRSQTSIATTRESKVVENGQAVVKGKVRDHLTTMKTIMISELGTVVTRNG